MATVISHISMSLDGYVGGPARSQGTRSASGAWPCTSGISTPVDQADVPWRDQLLNRGDAYIMGRNMFGPVRGPWQGDWRGWWGDEPPYHAPVFVLTHHEREPVEMAGGYDLFLVTGGFGAALEQARKAAGNGVAGSAGGASTVRQALGSGALDEVVVDIIPVVLGRGESMFGDLTNLVLIPVEVAHSPHANPHPVPGRVRTRRTRVTNGWTVLRDANCNEFCIA
jgi:dihydrofolate reductase